ERLRGCTYRQNYGKLANTISRFGRGRLRRSAMAGRTPRSLDCRQRFADWRHLVKVAELFTTSPDPVRRVRDDELDLFGLTHPGNVRPDNQDHFLVCTVHPEVIVHETSLGDIEGLPLRGERLATLF